MLHIKAQKEKKKEKKLNIFDPDLVKTESLISWELNCRFPPVLAFFKVTGYSSLNIHVYHLTQNSNSITAGCKSNAHLRSTT